MSKNAGNIVLEAKNVVYYYKANKMCIRDRDHELKYREIILIVGNYQVKIGKKLIDLTQKEYEILKELIENQGCVITRESFLNRLWKYEFEGEERAVDNHIKNLRRKLGKAGDYKKTVRGVG